MLTLGPSSGSTAGFDAAVAAVTNPLPAVGILPTDFRSTSGTVTVSALNSWTHLSFPATTGNIASTRIPEVARDWAQFDVEILWVNLGAGTGAVDWRVDVGTLGAGETLVNPAGTTTQRITAAAQGVAQRSVIATGVPVPAAGKVLTMRLLRAGNTDTLTNAVGVISVRLVKAVPFTTLVSDGMWEWWTRPNVAYRPDGKLNVAFVDATGDLGAVEYNPTTTTQARYQWYTLPTGPDDHANPCILRADGKPPIVFYSRHNEDTLLRYRVGTVVDDLSSMGAEQTIGSVFANVAYGEAFARGNEVHFFHRTASATAWSYIRSTDWMSTHAAPREVISYGYQTYMATALLADGKTLRCASLGHPQDASSLDHQVRYFEIDLATGDLSAPGVGVLGNVQTGANLPLNLAAIPVAYTPTAGDTAGYIFDVSDGPDPEVVFAQKLNDEANTTNSVYKRLIYTGGTWSAQTICATGGVFGDQVYRYYVGGACFPRQTPGNVVYTSRTDGRLWYLEKWATADGGATWQVTETIDRSATKIFRPAPIEGDGALTVAYVRGAYSDYTTYATDIVAR